MTEQRKECAGFLGGICVAVLIAVGVVFLSGQTPKAEASCGMPTPNGELVPFSVQNAAWHQALRYGDEYWKAKDISRWERPANAWRYDWLNLRTLPDGRTWRLLGYYHIKVDLDKRGRVDMCETIQLYIREEESELLLRQVLVHEYLHAIWWRLWQTDAEFRKIHESVAKGGGEQWVRDRTPWED